MFINVTRIQDIAMVGGQIRQIQRSSCDERRRRHNSSVPCEFVNAEFAV
jgi:hypothetical protein